MSRGRPRGFDMEVALDAALGVFWRQGYEGASLADLTAAMGINRPSMYAAFGNKEELFARVLDRYVAGPGGWAAAALAEDSAYGVIAAILRGAVEMTTGPDTPPGCLSVRSAQACGPEGEPARAAALAVRAAGEIAIRERLERADDLPPGADPAALARLVTTISDGIAVQAAGGATRADLHAVADLALASLAP
jgi:AcrR family transcriptional regulator